MELIVFISYNDERKANIRAEETENRLVLQGMNEDPHIFILIRQIIQIITHETPLENVQREFGMINEIIQCQH